MKGAKKGGEKSADQPRDKGKFAPRECDPGRTASVADSEKKNNQSETSEKSEEQEDSMKDTEKPKDEKTGKFQRKNKKPDSVEATESEAATGTAASKSVGDKKPGKPGKAT